MIHFSGELSLTCALLCAMLQSILPFIGYYKKNPYLIAFARPSSYGQLFFVILAYSLLTLGFVINDFSIQYIAANSHPTLPLIYQMTAPWGAHEGSILLWILILNLWTLIYSYKERNNEASALVIAFLGFISFSFLLFITFTSNPFTLAHAFFKAQDLNPLLQDPGFIIHPPMLYIGYVGLSVAFTMTQAALMTQRLDRQWAKSTRQFTIAAWCFLTGGIMLGSWWAYRVLGWGGFWFWDPVENASLLPWLSATALIHVLLLAEKRQTALSFAVFLSIISFALSLLGTFLVRSGILISAHTFASDPSRGVFLLMLFSLFVAMALFFYSKYTLSGNLKANANFSFLSKEMILLANSSFLIIAMLTILLGTLYPLIFDALHLESISVGAPYFNQSLLPIMFMMMSIMGFAAFCQWQKQSWQAIIKVSVNKILLSLICAAILLTNLNTEWQWLSFIILTLSGFILFCMISSLKKLPGMSIAHIGFACLIMGVTLSSLLSEEREVRLSPGSATHIGPYQFFFIDFKSIQGANYRGFQARFEVLKNTHFITYLYPEKRLYTVRDMIMTKVDIHPSIFRDLYLALGEPLEHEDWSVRIYYKPFIRFIWFGGILMIIGGLLALRQKYET